MCNRQFIFFLIILCSQAICLAQGEIDHMPLTADKREQYIQKALQFREKGDYQNAIKQVDVILTMHSNDAAALLLKGDLMAQNRQYDIAAQIYQKLLAWDDQKITIQINLSYALFMNNQPLLALRHAETAWSKDSTNEDATINYFNALLWNARNKQATAFLASRKLLLKQDQVLLMSARLYTSQGNFKAGLALYDTLVNSYTNKFYVKEYVEVLQSKYESGRAIEVLRASRNLFDQQSYDQILQSMESANADQIGTNFSYFQDLAQNVAISNNFWWQTNNGSNSQFGIRAGWSQFTSIQKEKTLIKKVGLSLHRKWNMALSSTTELDAQRIVYNEDRNFVSLTGKHTFIYQPHDRRFLGIFLSSDILNYTASLWSQNIRNNSIGYKVHFMFDTKNGMYFQGLFGKLSDGNSNIQFFGSVYHHFTRSPNIKSGINFTAIAFKENHATDYFSARRFRGTELFGECNFRKFGFDKLSLYIQSAVGAQNIDISRLHATFRLSTKLSYHSKAIESSIQYQTSNVASNHGSGYRFNGIRLSIQYKF